MKNVFLSWSGERSLMMAQALKDWLPIVIQSVDPWLSVSDIDKGTRWTIEISNQLQQQRIGIVCLTSDNLNMPWLLFETGALSKSIGNSFVCPYLLDIQPVDLKGPFTQFQATKADKEDTRNLLLTINKALGDAGIQENMLDKQFGMWWPDLEKKLISIPKAEKKNDPRRGDRELLEEVLELSRSIARNIVSRPTIVRSREDEQQRLRNSIAENAKRLRVTQALMDQLLNKVADEPSAEEKEQLEVLRSQIASAKANIHFFEVKLAQLMAKVSPEIPEKS